MSRTSSGSVRPVGLIENGRPWLDEIVTARVSSALDLLPLKRIGGVRWFITGTTDGPVGLVVSTREEQYELSI